MKSLQIVEICLKCQKPYETGHNWPILGSSAPPRRRYNFPDSSVTFFLARGYHLFRPPPPPPHSGRMQHAGCRDLLSLTHTGNAVPFLSYTHKNRIEQNRIEQNKNLFAHDKKNPGSITGFKLKSWSYHTNVQTVDQQYST